MSQALTVIAEVRDVPGLRAHLATIHDDLSLPASLPDTHFTRWMVIEDDARELAPVLAWESNHDGAQPAYLAACARAAGPGLDAIFAFCTDYPAGLAGSDPEGFARWIRKRSLRAQAFYAGYRGVTRAEVLNDRKVRDAIRAYVAANRPALLGLAPVEIQQRIRDHLRTTGLDITMQGDRSLQAFALRIGGYAMLGLVGLALLPLIAFLYWRVSSLAKTDPVDPIDRAVHGNPRHIEEEDKIVQNQLTVLVDVKPGWVRYWSLQIVLLVVGTLARVEYVHGDLGGITSIHFGRWVIVPDRRRGVARRRHRLLFFSNYDGSWDAYLGEFIDENAAGLTAIWSNTVGFPRTKGILEQGATDEEAFKQWTRNHQVFTDAWWSGVPDSTVDNVRKDVWVRQRVLRQLSDTELPEWLRSL